MPNNKEGLIFMNERYMSNQRSFQMNSLMLKVNRIVQEPIAMHQQEFAEVVFVLNGSAEYGTGPRIRETITKGDILIVPQHGKHAYYSVDQLEIFYILFVPENLPLPLLNLYALQEYRELFGRKAEYYLSVRKDYPKLIPPEEEFLDLIRHLNKIQEIQTHNRIGCDCEKLGLFMYIIGRLCDMWQKNMNPENKPAMLDMNKISAYLAENCNQNILLSDLAEMCSMSISTMLRHFHKAFGTTPIDYLKNIRLDRATALLMSTDLRVSEIADQCGFSSSSYFISVFRKKFGKTPEEFRKS